MAGMAGELNVGSPLGVNPLGQMRPRIQNRQTNKYVIKGACHHVIRSLSATFSLLYLTVFFFQIRTRLFTAALYLALYQHTHTTPSIA